jgi:hypothetical protein
MSLTEYVAELFSNVFNLNVTRMCNTITLFSPSTTFGGAMYNKITIFYCCCFFKILTGTQRHLQNNT